ncbi:MAG: CD1108 family mobile element protein [Blautia sp.]
MSSLKEQKFESEEKKVHRMTRDGLAEENLATGEMRKVGKQESELRLKASETEDSFVNTKSEDGQTLRKRPQSGREKPEEGSPPEEKESANGPPAEQNRHGEYQHGGRSSAFSHERERALEVRERKARHRKLYRNRRQVKPGKLQFDQMETDGSLKTKIPAESSNNPQSEGWRLQHSRKRAEKSVKKLAHAKKHPVRKKSIQLRRVKSEDAQTGKYKLYFEDTIPDKKLDGVVKKTGVRIRNHAGGIVHGEIKKGEDNIAVEAAHKGERSAEFLLRLHSSRSYRKQRKQQRTLNRLERNVYRRTTRYQYQKYLEEHPEMRRKLLQKALQKRRIKKEYQKAYRAGKAAKEIRNQSVRSVNVATKAARKVQEIFSRNIKLLLGAGLLMALLLFIMAGVSSCSAMFANTSTTVIASSYLAEPEALEEAELYYTQMEAELQQEINRMESQYPGMDEYRYNIGAIGHDPHTLMSYLTAKYGDFTFEEVKGELETLFSLQYGIKVEEKTETREETTTIQVGESLGNVVTSGYCNCTICCGVWSGGPTASGAMPQANHTIAVDAANPFLPMGTKVVMNGVEYTVEDTGNFAQYGVQFDVYYDSHSAASAHGHQTWECYLAEGNENAVEVTRTVTVDVLNVSVQAKPLFSVISSRMEEEEKEIQELVYSCKGNLQSYDTPIELNWYAYISTYYGYAVNSATGQTQLNRGVEINVKEGTEVQSAMNGIVADTGYSSTFGNYVVTQDEKGVLIKYAHLQNVAVSKGAAVTVDTVIGTTGSTGSVTGSQLYLELVLNGIYYNPVFYISTGEGGIYGGGASYDDETVQRLFTEAEKYLGMPYVWGGSSPETSFDCSGFVSYVFTNSGVCSMGRLTAQGIYNICTPVAPEEARPGDIIFFTGTYNAGEPVTHVGIYAGDGQMIHCGDPIQYTSITSAYWQSHFYGFGRPN